MSTAVTRRRALKHDANGDIRPYIGWRDDGKQPRFNLGKDMTEAEWRYAAIQRLYNDNCRDSGREVWSPRALAYAKEVAAGRKVIEFPAPPPQDRGAVIEYQQGLEQYRQMFPSLVIAPADPIVFGESVKQNQDYVAARLKELNEELKSKGAIPSTDALPGRMITGTLHEALDEYRKMIERDGERLPSGLLKHTHRKRLDRVKWFKNHHEDVPLYRLNFDVGSSMIAYWRKRPPTKKKANCSRSFAKHQAGELSRFFRWLDQTDHFQWMMPRGLGTVSKKIAKFDSEKKTSPVSKLVYTPEQLALLNKHATPLERLCLYCGLNFGMGQSELGRILISDVLLNHQHEYTKHLRFTSNKKDNWIRMNRPKTDVFGEWRVWPEVVVMLKWAIERAKTFGSHNLFLRPDGRLMFDESFAKPESPFTNLWDDFIERVQGRERNIPKYPFGVLRDTLPNFLRQEHGDDMATICLAHGRPANADTLLECYANKPFGRFHTLLPQVRKVFKCVFDAIDDPLAENEQAVPQKRASKRK